MSALPLSRLCRELQIGFADTALLRAAFTHSSYKNEHRRNGREDNERLEFLGDAVLELCVSRYLYDSFKDAPEGELTRLRAAAVCEPSLVALARELKFHLYLRLGKGEESSGGRERASLIADVFEAFVGALFLDQGIAAADAFLAVHVYPRIEDDGMSLRKDYKTMLQEHIQKSGLGPLSYDIVTERGPAHDREFVAAVCVAGQVRGEGAGRSKKEAEQNAARNALALD
ncbi:MAG: ribonuclease III [Bacilli bacterium]